MEKGHRKWQTKPRDPNTYTHAGDEKRKTRELGEKKYGDIQYIHIDICIILWIILDMFAFAVNIIHLFNYFSFVYDRDIQSIHQLIINLP